MTRWNLDRGRRDISYELSNGFSGISAWLPTRAVADTVDRGALRAMSDERDRLMRAYRTKISWALLNGVTNVFAAGWRAWGGPKRQRKTSAGS